MAMFLAGASAAAEPPATFPADAVRAEFDTLYEELRASHYDLYARRPKADYDALHRTMRARFDRPLTRPEIAQRFQTFMAYGRVAHSRIDAGTEAYVAFREAGGKAFPLAVRVVNGAVRVKENPGNVPQVAVGDEIVSLDGRPMREWLERAGRHVSADTDYLLHAQLESLFPAGLWMERGAAERFTLVLRKADGKQQTVQVPARSRDELKTAAASANSSSLELSWDTREARMTPGDVAYLRPGPFYNNAPDAADLWDATAFVAFIDQAFESFIAANAKSIVIDLRDNPGGDNSFSDPMIAWFATKPWRFCGDFRVKVSQGAIDTNAKRVPQEKDPGGPAHRYAEEYARRKLGEVFSFEMPLANPREGRRFSGKVYLLINRHSNSNTANVAAIVQDYGFGKVLGEETADLATTYGAMEQFDLPRTGITVGFPKALIVRPSGKRDARGVIPDVAIETPLPEPADDPVLKKALAVAAEKR
jgi:C-terminal processing protease CtpA/Prc